MASNNALVHNCREQETEYGEPTTIHSFLKYGKDGMRQRHLMPWDTNLYANKHALFLVSRDYVNCVLDGKFRDTDTARKIFAYGTSGKLPLDNVRAFNWKPYIIGITKALNTEINKGFRNL
jgi:hypothetical protein